MTLPMQSPKCRFCAAPLSHRSFRAAKAHDQSAKAHDQSVRISAKRCWPLAWPAASFYFTTISRACQKSCLMPLSSTAATISNSSGTLIASSDQQPFFPFIKHLIAAKVFLAFFRLLFFSQLLNEKCRRIQF